MTIEARLELLQTIATTSDLLVVDGETYLLARVEDSILEAIAGLDADQEDLEPDDHSEDDDSAEDDDPDEDNGDQGELYGFRTHTAETSDQLFREREQQDKIGAVYLLDPETGKIAAYRNAWPK